MKKIVAHYLYWLNEKTGTRCTAGVAFYSQTHDEYRLKIDFFPETQFYLKPIGLYGNKVTYRAEVAHKKHGRFIGRRSIGMGILTKETTNEIHLELGPFTNKLILSL